MTTVAPDARDSRSPLGSGGRLPFVGLARRLSLWQPGKRETKFVHSPGPAGAGFAPARVAQRNDFSDSVVVPAHLI